MSFATNRLALVQEHFIVVELDLPYIGDECVLPVFGGVGYGTPLTCTQSWDETTFKTYYFATDNLPVEYGRPRSSAGLPGDVIDMPDSVHLNVMSISESPSELKPGQGLAARLTLSVKLKDMVKDPGPRKGHYDTSETSRTLVIGDSVHIDGPLTGGGDGTFGNIYKSITVSGATTLNQEDYTVTANWEDLGAIGNDIESSGTFLGKLQARNIITNKEVRVKYFHVQADGIYTEADAQVRTYNGEVLENNGNGTYTLIAVDELKQLHGDKAQFPEPTGGTVRTAFDDSTSSNIDVDAVTDWEAFPRPYIVRIGQELFKIDAVVNNQTASAALDQAASRTADISFSNFITTKTAEAHDVGDEVQIAHTHDADNLKHLLSDILKCAGIIGGKYSTLEGTETLNIGDRIEVETGHVAGGTIGNVYESITVSGSTDLTAEDYSVGANWEDLGVALWSNDDWDNELNDWLSGVTIDHTWHEPISAIKVLTCVLRDYLVDMWYDVLSKKIKISAISVWKESSITLTEGKEINRDSIKITPSEQHRNARAFIHFNKQNKIEDDKIKHYKEISVNINATLESAGQFEKPKTKQFPNSNTLDTTRADLLVQRWVARFGNMPFIYTWITEERFLNFETGDIVDIVSKEIQDFDGTDKTVRAQILSIRPKWIGHTRSYDVKAMTYEPAFADGFEFTISGPSSEINLYIQAGAPSGVVTLTFLLDGDFFGSTDSDVPSIVAGSFAAGSHIDIVLQNGADWQGKGGNGGRGGNVTINATSGLNGSTVYDAQGIDTDIYLSKTFSGNAADGTLRAPGGGGGGQDYIFPTDGDGGGGGAGSAVGAGGAAPFGENPGSAGTIAGVGGAAGAGTAGAGGDWGIDGFDSPMGAQTGGDAGKGIVDGGATVNLFVDTYFLSSAGVSSIVPGDSVEVAGGHGAGGVVGDVYESLITDGARDLSAEDYTVGANWSRQFINGGGDAPASISA